MIIRIYVLINALEIKVGIETWNKVLIDTFEKILFNTIDLEVCLYTFQMRV